MKPAIEAAFMEVRDVTGAAPYSLALALAPSKTLGYTVEMLREAGVFGAWQWRPTCAEVRAWRERA